MFVRNIVLALVVVLAPCVASATALWSSADSAVVESAVMSLPAATPAVDTAVVAPKRSFFKRIVDYFTEDSVEMAQNDKKRFRFSLLGGPNYANDMKFAVALAGVMQYRLNGCDAPMQASSATISATVSTAKFWSLWIYGTTYFPNDRMRINTDIALNYSPRDFWGIGYYRGNSDTKCKLHQVEARIKGELLMRLAPAFFVGPILEWDYSRTGDIDLPELLDGQDNVVRNYGLGVTLEYDSRDLATNASRGLHLYLSQLFRPKFLWNHYAFSTTDFRAHYYHTAWRGAIIAGELRGLFNFGNPSWAMMALLGDNRTMRGYYKGRYRDKHMATLQVEVRQHIYKRIGAVVWGGMGSVFHDKDTFKHILPNYGIGLRWEFRNRVNIRLDYGFGKSGQNGFMFSINEAF